MYNVRGDLRAYRKDFPTSVTIQVDGTQATAEDNGVLIRVVRPSNSYRASSKIDQDCNWLTIPKKKRHLSQSSKDSLHKE